MICIDEGSVMNRDLLATCPDAGDITTDHGGNTFLTG